MAMYIAHKLGKKVMHILPKGFKDNILQLKDIIYLKKMKKIKTILIGMGKIGYTDDLYINKKIQTHYKALNQNKYIDLVGVVENKKIFLKNKKQKIYKNISEIKSLNFELAVMLFLQRSF